MARIYVASLSDYNNGHLHGRLVDLDGLDVDDVKNEIADLLGGSKYPNVTIECPKCEGNGHYISDPLSSVDATRKACEGNGGVPSAKESAVHDYDDLPSSFGEHPDLSDLRRERARCDSQCRPSVREGQRRRSPANCW